MIYKRHITTRILEALSDTPVVFLTGARQTGKSTLVKHLAQHEYQADYYTFDDQVTLSAATKDPQGFISGLKNNAIIDEAQLVPALFPAIKHSIDNDRQPGRFILTGSTSTTFLPKISESLAGRIEIHTLWPLSVSEIKNANKNYIDTLYQDDLTQKVTTQSENILDRIVNGGYPEPIQRKNDQRKQAWFRNYITTIIQRDIRQIANITGFTLIPDILQILSTRCASLVNFSDISRSLNIPQTSLKRYLALLEAIFLIHRVQPWSSNLGSRIFKTPKIYINDTGLLCFLLGIDKKRLIDDSTLSGHVLENFVANELLKDISWSNTQPRFYHFLTHSGIEADIVLEDAQGRCVVIEVKRSATVNNNDLKGISYLQEILKDKFHRGVILYSGNKIIPFNKNIHALPITTIWSV